MTTLTEAEAEALLDSNPHIWRAGEWLPVKAAVEAIVAARLASVKALADEWEAEGDEMSHWFAAQVLYDLLDQAHPAALRSDAHTEQKGAGA